MILGRGLLTSAACRLLNPFFFFWKWFSASHRSHSGRICPFSKSCDFPIGSPQLCPAQSGANSPRVALFPSLKLPLPWWVSAVTPECADVVNMMCSAQGLNLGTAPRAGARPQGKGIYLIKKQQQQRNKQNKNTTRNELSSPSKVDLVFIRKELSVTHLSSA